MPQDASLLETSEQKLVIIKYFYGFIPYSSWTNTFGASLSYKYIQQQQHPKKNDRKVVLKLTKQTFSEREQETKQL